MPRPTMDELRAQLPAKGSGRRGLYAAPPGTGPEGKTCGDCAFLTYTGNVKQHPKCGRTKFTHGDATTILVRSPACRHFLETACPCGDHPEWERHARLDAEGRPPSIADPMSWYNRDTSRAGQGVPPCVLALQEPDVPAP